MIVAIPSDLYNDGSHCGHQIYITNLATGITQNATAADSCPSCPGGDIDMSPALFQSLGADLSVGELTVTWDFYN